MIVHWDEFEAGPTEPKTKRRHVTLGPRCNILLNKNVFEMMGKPAAVMLMFDRMNSLIGLRSIHAERPGAFPVQQRRGLGNYLVRATPFCKHHGIRVEETNAFIEPEIDEDGVLRLDLRKTRIVSRRPPRRN